MDVIIPLAIITFVFAYLAININKTTNDNRFFPLTIAFLFFTLIGFFMTSDAIFVTWNGTINDTAGGIYNETTMPVNTGGISVIVATFTIIIIFAIFLIMILKEAFEAVIKLIKTGGK